MEDYKHPCDSLDIADRAIATIRHETDGSLNKIGVSCVVVNNYRREKELDLLVIGDQIYRVPYCDAKPV